MATYDTVNGVWPAVLPIPTPEEAARGAKKLYRLGYRIAKEDLPDLTSTPLKNIKTEITSGNRRTSIRRGVIYVNPTGHFYEGWKDIVHDLSHWTHRRFWPRESGHAPRHSYIEKTMIEHVVTSGWLEGALRRPEKPIPNIKATRAARIAARIKSWEAKKKRAENALKKLRRQAKYYENAKPG